MAAAAPPDPAAACDGPGWRVASASVDGAPAGFDAGDAGRTYLWHDDGWHLRTTDVNNAPHLYTGTISASPGATSVDVHKIRLDPADHLWVDDHQVLHYSFVTHAGIDGIDLARELRLTMLRERRGIDEDDDLLDPERAADTVHKSAAELDARHDSGCHGPRPVGRLRSHPIGKDGKLPARQRWFTAPIYRSFLDPDGRSLDMRLRRTY